MGDVEDLLKLGVGAGVAFASIGLLDKALNKNYGRKRKSRR